MWRAHGGRGRPPQGEDARGPARPLQRRGIHCLLMEDSVRLAESILDDAEIRLGDPTTRMRVMQGEFGRKQGEREGREAKRRVLDKKKAAQQIILSR